MAVLALFAEGYMGNDPVAALAVVEDKAALANAINEMLADWSRRVAE